MQRVSPQTLHALLILLILTGTGCAKPAPPTEGKLVLESLRQIAPEGGSGVKAYNYDTGGLREKVFWDRFHVTKIEYYTREQVLLYTALVNDPQPLLLSLDDAGLIQEVFQVKDFIKHGYCFVFCEGRLKTVQGFSHGNMISEVSVSDTPIGDRPQRTGN